MKGSKGKLNNDNPFLHLSIILESFSVSKVKVSQEMNALLFIVGEAVPRTLSQCKGKLPKAAFFEPFMAAYNLKVQKKLNAKELRRAIASKIDYIKRRAKKGQEPWYK